MPIEPHVAGMTLMDVRDGRCRWPLNDGSPFLFCCSPTMDVYCQPHRRLAYGPGTEQERSAHRTLKQEMTK